MITFAEQFRELAARSRERDTLREALLLLAKMVEARDEPTPDEPSLGLVEPAEPDPDDPVGLDEPGDPPEPDELYLDEPDEFAPEPEEPTDPEEPEEDPFRLV